MPLSLFWMLERDRGRLEDGWKRADFLPLGAGALAGSTFPLDREFLARELGFSRVTPQQPGRGQRPRFPARMLGGTVHPHDAPEPFLRGFDPLVIGEFGFVELDDAFATGSSMMPQKKNPDSLELIRGKCGRVYGDLDESFDHHEGDPSHLRQGHAGR